MRFLLPLVFCAFALPAVADVLGTRLSAATQTHRLFVLLAAEAERSGADVDYEFLNGQGGQVFAETVTRLNDPARVAPRFDALVRDALDDETIEALLVYLESDEGQKVVDLELSAREAFSDPEIELMVRARVKGNGTPELVQELITVSDLIERNVADGTESLRQFYLGRLAGGATDMTRTEIDEYMLETEDWLRQDTTEWLEGYLTLAYSPLSEEELQTYVDLWRTDAWKAYDDALFAAFATLFEENAFAMGQLVGRLGMVNEI